MTSAFTRRPTWIIFAAALALRLLYLAFVPQPAVQFDARLYTAAAVAAPYVAVHPELWGSREIRDQVDFLELYDDVISDEKVSWYPYGMPYFADAADNVFYGGPVMSGFFGAIFYLAPRHDFWCARIALAILDSLTAVLLWAVLRRLTSSRGAAIGAGLWVVYLPGIIKTGEIVTETLSTLLCVATVLAVLCAFETRSARRLLLAGALAALLALTKASAALLVVAALAAWLMINRAQLRRAMRECALILVGWLVVLAPWFLVVFLRYGSVGFRDPSYGTANFRQANSLVTEGYLADAAPADFWTFPVLREMASHPGAYAALYIEKFRRLWWHACDDYLRVRAPWQEIMQWGHRLIVLFALLGVLVWVGQAGPPAWLPLSIIAYFIALHTVMHVISRYNLVPMPLVCGAATVGGLWLAREERRGALMRFLAAVAMMAAAIWLIGFLSPTTWLLIPGVSTGISVWLRLFAAVGIVGSVTFILVSRRAETPMRTFGLTAAVGGIIAVVLVGWLAPREGHAEWGTRIDRVGVQVRRTIDIPAGALPDSIEDAYLAFDARLEHNSSFDIVLNVVGAQAKFRENLIASRDDIYLKANYSVMMKLRDDQQWEVRRWSRHRLEPSVLDTIRATHRVTVTLSIDTTRAHRGALWVYGDLPPDDSATRALPGFNFSSIERYFEGGDPRIWDEIPFQEGDSQSTLIVDGKQSSNDLSPQFGRQTGEYRILLVLLLPDGRELYY